MVVVVVEVWGDRMFQAKGTAYTKKWSHGKV